MQKSPNVSALEGMQHLWKVLVIHWEAYTKVNREPHPIQNLADAGAYGDLWHHQGLEGHSSGDEVEVRPADLQT